MFRRLIVLSQNIRELSLSDDLERKIKIDQFEEELLKKRKKLL